MTMRVAVFMALWACGPVHGGSVDARLATVDADVAYVDADEPIIDASPAHADTLALAVDASLPPSAGPCDIETSVDVLAPNGTRTISRVRLSNLGSTVPDGRVMQCGTPKHMPYWYSGYPLCADGVAPPCTRYDGVQLMVACFETPIYATEHGYVAICSTQTENVNALGETTIAIPFDENARIEIHR